ncbi:MAG TPA: hypothetical protein PK093_24135 [Phycisphaerae bacterium]|nr:hypothetical protein [Phycisphaerae bacterium]
MDLEITFAPKDRLLEKSLLRIKGRFERLEREFAGFSLDTPRFEAILVLVSDDKQSGYFRVVKNNDGYFQVISGIEPTLPEEQLVSDIFDLVRRAILECPDVESRKKECEEFLDDLRPSIVGKS